jgi:HlyD family secretion protein
MKHRPIQFSPVMLLLLLLCCSDNGGAPSGSGFVEGTEVVLSAETAGRIEEVYREEGDQVRQGDVIALIDTTAVSLRLAEARARLRAADTRVESARLQIEKADVDSALARKDYERARNLLENESTSRQQFDQAETRYRQSAVAAGVARAELEGARAGMQQAERELDLLKRNLEDCRPTSPLSGTVVTSYIERGEFVGVGSPLVKVAELDPVTVKIYLPPALLTGVKLGAEAMVDPEDGRTRPRAGKVTWISPEAEFTPKNVQTKEARADLVYAVKVTVPNPDQVLKIGMPVMVTLP